MSNKLTSLPLSGYLLTDEGMYRYGPIQLFFIGTQNDVLKECATQVPVDVRHLTQASLLGTTAPVHMQVVGRQMSLYTRLPSLPLHTSWTLYDSGKLAFPSWERTPPEGTLVACYHWTPPKNMGLFYINLFTTGLTNAGQPDPNAVAWSAAFLVAVTPNDKRFFRLPTGNVNDAGVICMGAGNVFKDNPKLPILDRFSASLASFLASPWNNDLIKSTESQHRPLFSFTSDGKTQQPVPEDWHRHCMAINHLAYSNLPLHALTQ